MSESNEVKSAIFMMGFALAGSDQSVCVDSWCHAKGRSLMSPFIYKKENSAIKTTRNKDYFTIKYSFQMICFFLFTIKY